MKWSEFDSQSRRRFLKGTAAAGTIHGTESAMAQQTDADAEAILTGEIDRHNGNSEAYIWITATVDDSPIDEGGGKLVDWHFIEDRSFSLSVPDEENVILGFFQGDPATETYIFFDGNPDVQSLGSHYISGNTDLGTFDIPEGHRLNIQVIDESGIPVEDAITRVHHEEDESFSFITGRTNADGQYQNNETDPGIEIAGDVLVAAAPPEADDPFGENSISVELTVTSPTEAEVELPVSLDSSTPTTETPSDETPPETAPSTVPYDLRAGTKTEIRIGDTTFYVIRDIPDADPQRVAVTTPEYDLVAQPESRQAILVNAYLNDPGYLSQLDEQTRISLIENAKRKAAAWSRAETAARLGDVAADILAAWASAHAGITVYSYAEVLDALDSVIVWGTDWAEDPYKQQFTEMMMACRNIEWVKKETEDVEDLSADAPGVTAVLATLVKAYDEFENTRDVLAGWQLLRESARTTGSTSDFLLVTGTIEIAKVAKGIFLGIIFDKSFGEADDFFEITAEIDGIMHAYQTIRRSIHKRLLEIETAAREGTLTPGQIYEYEILNYTRHQLRAMAHHFAAQRIVELADDDLSLLWNALINAQTNHEQFSQNADVHAWLAKAHCILWGGREKSVRKQLDNSINAEIIESFQ